MKIIYVILLGTTFFSCDMQTTLEVDLPVEKPKLVVNCFFSADSMINVRVWSSKHVLANEPDRLVENAEVKILEEGKEYVCPYNKENRTYRSTIRSRIGVRYAVSVSAAGFETVTSAVTVPEPIAIINVTSARKSTPEVPGIYMRTFEITFKDIPGQLNYYALMMYTSSFSRVPPFERLEWIPLMERPLDPSFAADYYEEFYFNYGTSGYGDYNVLFNDRMFDGKTYTFKLDVYEQTFPEDTLNNTPLEYLVYLKTLTEEYYNYRVTYNKQRDARDDPFAQPVEVFNNINNGYGVFAAFSQSVALHKIR